MTALELAHLAIAEYNANFAQGGEMEYPHWAEKLIAEHKKSQQPIHQQHNQRTTT